LLVYRLIVFGLVASVCGACATLSGLLGSYDDRTLAIHTVDLFDQHRPPVGGFPDWKGDWIFRRERLAAADKFLRSEKPDILVLQNVLSRQGSPSETDAAILQAGALVGFEFESQVFTTFADTQEEAALSVATSLPVSIVKVNDPQLTRTWSFGNTGYMALSVIENEGESISLFNVRMPDGQDTNVQSYDFVFEKIDEHFRSGTYCRDRLIIAGYLPYPERAQDLFERLNLQDAAEEACSLNADCYTRSPMNGLGNLADPSAAPGRVDRILVSNEAIIFGSSRGFDETTPVTEYLKRWQLTKTWSSIRFGWSAEVRFPSCK
jgi:hypothetical protein